MREDEYSSDQPIDFNAHQDDSKWEYVGYLVALLSVAAIAILKRSEMRRLRYLECLQCDGVFISARDLLEHERKMHSK